MLIYNSNKLNLKFPTNKYLSKLLIFYFIKKSIKYFIKDSLEKMTQNMIANYGLE